MQFNYLLKFVKGIVLIQLFLLALIAGLSLEWGSRYMVQIPYINFDRILIPFSKIHIQKEQAEIILEEANPLLVGNGNLAKRWLDADYVTRTVPQNIIGSHIPALANSDVTGGESQLGSGEADKMPFVSDPEKVKPTPTDSIFKDYQVYLYCTHSSESYIPDSGQAKQEGKRGLINKVALELTQSLKNSGLAAVFDDKIHDYPDYNKSYTNSRETIKKITESSSKILAVLDIHRDSIPGASKAGKVKIKGKNGAQILIIVGTDQRKTHPNWKKNNDFAERIYRQGEKMYPGLIRGVRTQAGTYNQEYHTHALLLEIGSDNNSLDEANYAAQLFAEVLAEVLKEEIEP